jgi:hypothetical protein
MIAGIPANIESIVTEAIPQTRLPIALPSVSGAVLIPGASELFNRVFLSALMQA